MRKKKKHSGWDCGQCKFCKDMVKFGGPGKKKAAMFPEVVCVEGVFCTRQAFEKPINGKSHVIMKSAYVLEYLWQ